MQYKSIYPFWVIDEIRAGKKVLVLDKKFKKVYCVNDSTVEAVVKSIECAEKEHGRYEFWYEESEENEKD